MNQAMETRLTFCGTVYSKKNSKRIVRNKKTGQMAIVSNDAARANEQDMALQFRLQTKRKISTPCEIDIVIYEPNHMRRDLDNQATSILDALKKAGVILDDDFKNVQSLRVSIGGIDHENPRAEITIKEVKDGKI